MSSDNAEQAAAELLPCGFFCVEDGCSTHDKTCAAFYRGAVAAKLREIRRDALIEAAKAICPICAMPPRDLKQNVHLSGVWFHSQHGYDKCAAGPIWDLLQGEPK